MIRTGFNVIKEYPLIGRGRYSYATPVDVRLNNKGQGETRLIKRSPLLEVESEDESFARIQREYTNWTMLKDISLPTIPDFLVDGNIVYTTDISKNGEIIVLSSSNESLGRDELSSINFPNYIPNEKELLDKLWTVCLQLAKNNLLLTSPNAFYFTINKRDLSIDVLIGDCKHINKTSLSRLETLKRNTSIAAATFGTIQHLLKVPKSDAKFYFDSPIKAFFNR